MNDILLYFGAAAVGFVMSFFGGGGAMLCLPLLTYVGGYSRMLSVPATLLVIAAAVLVTFIQNLRKSPQLIFYKYALFLIPTGMVGSYLGAWASLYLNQHLAMVLFALLMFVISYYMLKTIHKTHHPLKLKKRNILKVVVTGFVIGLTTGLLGASGGLLIVPALFVFFALDSKEAVATAILVVLVNVAVALVVYSPSLPIIVSDGRMLNVVGIAAISAVGTSFLFQKVKSGLLQKAFAYFVAVLGLSIFITEIRYLF